MRGNHSRHAIGILTLVAEEGTRDVDLLGSHKDNVLSLQELLGDNTGQTTKHVVLTVDNDKLFESHNDWVWGM